MSNLIVAMIIVLILSFAILKIIWEKRQGTKCVGCALSGKCDTSKDNKRSVFLSKRIEIKELN